jgi:hypothetical protein
VGGAGQQEQRRIVTVGLRHARKGILNPGSTLRREDADLLSVRRARDAIGNMNADAFLAADDRTNADLSARVDQKIAWIAD